MTGPGPQHLGVVAGKHGVASVAEQAQALGGAGLFGRVVTEDREAFGHRARPAYRARFRSTDPEPALIA